jgi:hypothetical protein
MKTLKKVIFMVAILGIFESMCIAQQLKQVNVQNGIKPTIGFLSANR